MIVDINNDIAQICDDLDAIKFRDIKDFIENERGRRMVDDILLAISVNTSSVIIVAAKACHGNPQHAALYMLSAIMGQVHAVLSDQDDF
ncbi:MAG TPA: hypothetical protein VIF40_20500 [Methylosinus sp.]|jgi:hypothetical protein|uniref:hypothetical protein n=1 Tax=Methylosinus sp. TaxID=427 RepID=UPI002F9217F2